MGRERVCKGGGEREIFFMHIGYVGEERDH